MSYSELPLQDVLSDTMWETLEAAMGLTHVFTAPDASTRTLPDLTAIPKSLVGDFQGHGEAPGGFTGATARISLDEYNANLDVFTYGATWRVFDDDDPGADPVWAGALIDPIVQGGAVTLQGEGWARRAEKFVPHMAWQTRSLDEWATGDTDPHNYQADDEIDLNINGRSIVFRIRRDVVFKRNNLGNPANWVTSAVCYLEGVNLSRIAFSIDKSKNTQKAELELVKANGPAGAFTVFRTISLGAGGATSIDEPITGSPDLVGVRFKRTDEGKKDPFRVRIHNIRVNGHGTSGDSYNTSQMIADVAAKVGGNTSDIGATTRNGLPFIAMDETAAAICDEISLMDDRPWLILDNGTTRAWRYRPWTNRTYELDDEEFPVELAPRERINVIVIPYRTPGGVRRRKRVSNPDLPGGIRNELVVELDDPLPGEQLATDIATLLLDRLGAGGVAGSATFHRVKQGANTFPASRVKPGDSLELVHYGGRVVHVESIQYGDTTAIATFPERDAILDRFLKRRQILAARGRPNAAAVLRIFGLDRPKVPTGLDADFIEADRRNGRRHFHMVLTWNEVTEDLNSKGTIIQRYVIRTRPLDLSNAPIPDNQGGGWRRFVVDRKDDDDPDTDAPTRLVIRNIERPRRWKWESQVLAVDVLGQKSNFSAKTTPERPVDAVPPAPTGATLELKRRKLTLEFDLADTEETETDTSEAVFDRAVAYVRCKRFMSTNGGVNWTQVGKTLRLKDTEKTWTVRKPSGKTFKCEIASVDGDGNVSSTVTVNVTRKKPGKPTNVRRSRSPRRIRWRWDSPTAWSDGTTTDFDPEDEVKVYDATVYHNDVVDEDRSDHNVKANHYAIEVPKGSTGWRIDVTAKGVDGEDAGALVDATTVDDEPVTATDGNPPSSSPNAPTLNTDVPYTIRADWTPVVNNDPVTYEIHASTTTGFTPGPTTKKGEDAGTSFFIRGLIAGTTYFVKIIAKDADGAAAAGTQSSAVAKGAKAIGDGSVPPTPSAPNLTAGYRALLASWTAVTNNDPVTYEVHISTTTGFTPSSSTIVAETEATAFVIEKLNNGSRLVVGTTYFVKLIAKDADGSSSASSQSSASPSGVAPPDLVAGTLAANWTITGMLSVPSTSGWRVEIGNSSFPIRYWNGSTTRFTLDTAGNINMTGATITAGTVQTATGNRIELSSVVHDTLAWRDTSDVARALVNCSSFDTSAELSLFGWAGIRVTRQLVIGVNANTATNYISIRNVLDNATIPTPPAGFVNIFYNTTTGRVNAKDESGAVRVLNETVF